MCKSPMLTLLCVLQVALFGACGPDSPEPVLGPDASLLATSRSGEPGPRWSEWSEPTHLGPTVNSPSRELGGELSPDGLSLYFGSDRPGGFGSVDIWASRRACRDCPWEAPVVLGENVNSPAADGGPAFSPDRRLLFFSSARAGGHGGDDIWVSRRKDPMDDFGWGPPVNLGPSVNTADHETGPVYRRRGAEGNRYTLHFVRGATLPDFDIYQVAMTHDAQPVGTVVAVAELNHPTLLDGDPTFSTDGREMFFWSTRPGLGGADIWTATRLDVGDSWSTPRNIGPLINTAGGDLTPGLSSDGRTMVFSAAARPGLGLQDLWMTTRSRLDDDGNDDD